MQKVKKFLTVIAWLSFALHVSGSFIKSDHPANAWTLAILVWSLLLYFLVRQVMDLKPPGEQAREIIAKLDKIIEDVKSTV